MEVIMSMFGVPREVSGCDNNVELNRRYKWIKLTLKASERDANGRWMSDEKGECIEDKKVYENEERRMQLRWRCLHVTLKAITLFVVSADWKCSKFYWKCQNGICISKDYVCDDEDDCGDGSDERNCRKLVFMTVVLVVVVIVAAWAFDVENICHVW